MAQARSNLDYYIKHYKILKWTRPHFLQLGIGIVTKYNYWNDVKRMTPKGTNQPKKKNKTKQSKKKKKKKKNTSPLFCKTQL